VSIAPIEPVEQPETTPTARVPLGREALFALVVAVVVAALGAPVGLLWSRVAPHVELVQTQYGPYPVDGEPEGYWADDGWFIVMAIAMGILVAVAAWLLLRRYRGPVMLASLVVGSAAASVLGAWLGNKIGYAHYLSLVEHAPVNTHILRPVKLRTGASSLLFGFIPWVRGTMLVQALTAAAVYTALAGFHASPTLRYETMPAEYLDPQPVDAQPIDAQPVGPPGDAGPGAHPGSGPYAQSDPGADSGSSGFRPGLTAGPEAADGHDGAPRAHEQH
jgi:hypothetical protein